MVMSSEIDSAESGGTNLKVDQDFQLDLSIPKRVKVRELAILQIIANPSD